MPSSFSALDEELQTMLHKLTFSRQLLTPISKNFTGLEEFILTFGVSMYAKRDFPAHKYPTIPRTKKECYRNAYQLMSHDPTLTYCEGFALPSEQIPIPMLHAWCTDSDGVVLDPTWDNPSMAAYFGVTFNRVWVHKTVVSRGVYGILDDWENRWPILSTPKRLWSNT